MNKIRIGILGCADVARKNAIPAFQTTENAQLISIASRDSNKAKEWSSCYNISFNNSYKELLNRNDLDAVYIPLPIGLHEEWALKAAQAGKHIICEKSLSDNLQSVKRIVESCRKNDVILYENFMCDFHPQHQKVLSLIKERNIGEPFVFKSYFGFPLLDKKNFRYNKSLGGGSLNDVGAYTVFMARKIIGSEPISITCNLFINPEFNVDTQGAAHLEFPDQKVGLVSFGFNNVYQNNYSIWGTTGLIKVNNAYSISSTLKPSVELLTNKLFKEIISLINIPAANQFKLIFHDFCDTVLNKDKNQDKLNKTYSKILTQAKVMEAMRISARENRKVMLNEIE